MTKKLTHAEYMKALATGGVPFPKEPKAESDEPKKPKKRKKKSEE
jgi:hypothetical protein